MNLAEFDVDKNESGGRGLVGREDDACLNAYPFEMVEQSRSVDEFDGLVLAKIIGIGAIDSGCHQDALIGAFIHHGAV